jgi:DNA-binding beta-propeller fold protein YncE
MIIWCHQGRSEDEKERVEHERRIVSGILTISRRYRTRRLIGWICLLVLAVVTAASAPATAGGYHVIKEIPVGGEGGWDYLVADAATRRLYVSHATQVEVLDIDSGAVVGKIPNTQGVHGIALAPDLGRGFTSNGRAATITIFDLKTLAVLGEVPTGKNPDAILYDSATLRVFTFNRGSSDSTIVDAANGTVAGTIELGGKPEFATTDGAGHVFVNLQDKNTVAELDTRRLAVAHRWPLAPCEDPTGMAIDARNHRLFIGCGNQMMAVLDTHDGHVVTTLPIGSGVDANAFDPETGMAFSSNGEGTLTVIREDAPDKFHVVENVKTQRGARTMALDPKTHDVFLPVAEFGPAPAATKENPRPRPSIKPGTFSILVLGP